MNQAKQPTLTFWKITATASHALLWLAVAAWVIFALAWMALHWVIVPRIGEFRPRLEIEVSKVVATSPRHRSASSRRLNSKT
jgi:lysylphosphatidylglycerol synthetase-like protein (DUF2156 family)